MSADYPPYLIPPDQPAPAAPVSSAYTASPRSSPLIPEKVPRSLALDALRGLAILGMVLSGMVPYHTNTLPAWMYHAQNPPPTHVYDAAISGITWVDVVFPMFLFALGAAIPLALGPRLSAGSTKWGLVPGILLRGGLLLFFALYKQHLQPSLLRESYGATGLIICIGAFVVLFPVFARLPRQWPGYVRWALRGVGWALAIALLASIKFADGSGFTVHKHDIIIVILAHVAVSTSIIWLIAGNRILARLLLMALVATLMFATKIVPWAAGIMDLSILQPLLGDRLFNALTWVFRPAYQQYLLITLPGTIAGTILADWLRPTMNQLSLSIRHSRWRELGTLRCFCLFFICLAMLFCALVGLHHPDAKATIASTLALGATGLLVLYSPPARERLRSSAALRGQPRVNAYAFRALYTWGLVWLAVGLVLLPIEGIIKKDPPTYTYLFICAGLAQLALVMLAVITDALQRPGLLYLLTANGQNPMIAYVAGGMVLIPVLFLVPVQGTSLLEFIGMHTQSQPLSFARAIGYTLLTALLVAAITRLKIFWRT